MTKSLSPLREPRTAEDHPEYSAGDRGLNFAALVERAVRDVVVGDVEVGARWNPDHGCVFVDRCPVCQLLGNPPPPTSDAGDIQWRCECRATGGYAWIRDLAIKRAELDLDDEAPDEENPRPVLIAVGDVERERVAWTWPGWLPRGKLVLCDADPGIGKSTISLDLAARITVGGEMPDGSRVAKGAVIVLSAEDGLADTIRPRLEAAGADLSAVFVLDSIEEDGRRRLPSLPRDADLIGREAKVRGAALIIIDPLDPYLEAGLKSTVNQDVRRALHPLAKAVQRSGATVLAIRHFTKSGGDNPVYRGTGSIGTIAAARVGWIAVPDPDDPDRSILAVSKNNLAKKPKAVAFRLVPDLEFDCARVVWTGETDHDARSLLGAHDEDSDRRAERNDAVEVIQEYLADGAKPATEILVVAEQHGISKRTLNRAKKPAGAASRKRDFDGKWEWYLVGDEECQEPSKGANTPQLASLDATSDVFADESEECQPAVNGTLAMDLTTFATPLVEVEW